MKSSLYSHEYEITRSWLKSKRKELGLSLRDTANKLGITYTILGKIERGERKVDFVEFIIYCKILESDPSELIDKIIELQNKRSNAI
jgi:transcriptional regulator with XRE-family HTH domain